MPGLKLIRANGETTTRECDRLRYTAKPGPFNVDVIVFEGRTEYVDETITNHDGDTAYYLIEGTTHDTIKWKKT